MKMMVQFDEQVVDTNTATIDTFLQLSVPTEHNGIINPFLHVIFFSPVNQFVCHPSSRSSSIHYQESIKKM